jgi:hypothetical protein
MKKILTGTVMAVCAMGVALPSFAGNKDRIGQAGATELLINPWAQSSGTFGQNTAYVKGLDAMKNNVAGLAFVEKTELGVSHTMYLKGSGVSVNNLGFAQKLGNAGVVGVNIMAMSFGEIPILDIENPEQGLGTYKPQFFNLNAAFAKEFSNSIHAGVGVTFVSEQISNAKASGAAFEAGIQYVTGKRDNFHFGITLRNIGTNMTFTGSGFSVQTDAPNNTAVYQLNRNIPTEKFEMPTYLNFGAAYDFYLDENRIDASEEQKTETEEDRKSMPKHRLTAMASFTSNSFNNDFLGGGLEYGFKEMFMARVAYRWEKSIGNDENSTTFYTGLSAGATICTPNIGDKGPKLAFDYAFRPTERPANGVHTFTVRILR